MILVVGATGLLGGRITQQLLQNGEDVRILIRENSPTEELAKQGLGTPAQLLIDAGAEPIYGDLKDQVSLIKACHGVKTVITTANSILREGEDTIETVDCQGTQNLIDAAQGAGVQHFIYTSANRVHVDHPNPFYRAKATCEERLVASGMNYTILKPGMFMEVWIGAVVGIPLRSGLPITLVGSGNRHHIFVALRDVVDYAVTAVTHPAARNAKILIGGPASYSWLQIAETVGKVVGRPLPINFVPLDKSVPLIPEIMSPMLSALELFDDELDMHETALIYDIEPTPLQAFAEEFFGVPA